MDWVQKILNQDKRSLARMISWIENNDPQAEQGMRKLFSRTGRAYRIGITGPPGAGKSTLTNKLAKEVRKTGERVAIIAVDPSSPFSGGAILGDRVRMADLTEDEGVFIRSMGSRGHLGGLALATSMTAMVLDAAGYEWIFIETVGVGQSEIDIADNCDTTLMVTVPGLGDEIQAMKAGILEIGDVFAVNKFDLDGAAKTLRELEMMLNFNSLEWRPTVHKVVAKQNEGVLDLWHGICAHKEWQENSGVLKKRRNANCRKELVERVQNAIIEQIQSTTVLEKKLNEMAELVYERKSDPFAASEELLKRYHQHELHD